MTKEILTLNGMIFRTLYGKLLKLQSGIAWLITDNNCNSWEFGGLNNFLFQGFFSK